MKILYSQSEQRVLFYPRQDNEPILGLDSDFLVLNKINTSPPEITESQSLSFTYVVDIPSLEYRQQWTVIDNPPIANWDNFNLQMMSDPRFNQVYSQCLSIAPIICNAIPTALDQVSTKGNSLFTLIWNQLCTIGGATSEDKQVWSNYAVENNLPTEFINILTA